MLRYKRGSAVSGFSGLYNLDGRPVDPGLLEGMMEAIIHRGPDRTGKWIDGPVALGHLMLHTTPESEQERQPIRSEGGGCCLVLDGRIDNREELGAAIESKGFSLRDNTDAALILRAYECWAEECAPRLLGDFAFAVWDHRRRSLFCARDHLGTRPFYYYNSSQFFAFASEIRSLLAVAKIPRRLNEFRVADFLIEGLERVDKESTFYRGIWRLPAGNCMMVGPKQFKIQNYWQLKAPPTLKLGSLREYGEAFRAVFVEAVRCRLRSNHPVGSTLSGGVDSSSVVCTVRELLTSELKTPLHTISLVDADERHCGETPFIQEVLRGGRITPHIVHSEGLGNLEEAMRCSDEPFEIARYFFQRFAFAAAQRAGVRVLLDGVPGDFITPHANRLATLLRSLDWVRLAAELSYLAKIFQQSRLRILLNHALIPLMPRLYLFQRRLRGRDGGRIPDQSVINTAFAARTGASRRLDDNQRLLWDMARDASVLHCWSFTSGILPFFFEECSRLAASMGVEPRHPFSDRRIVEFFLSLPLRAKLSAPLTKIVIRLGMQGILPEKVRLRTSFAHPGAAFLASLLREHAILLEPRIFMETLEPVREYVSLEKIALDRERALAGSKDAAWAVWQALNLALWVRAKNLPSA